MPGLLYFTADYMIAPSGNEETRKAFKAKHVGSERGHATTAGHYPMQQRDQRAGPRLAAGSMVVMRMIMGFTSEMGFSK